MQALLSSLRAWSTSAWMASCWEQRMALLKEWPWFWLRTLSSIWTMPLKHRLLSSLCKGNNYKYHKICFIFLCQTDYQPFSFYRVIAEINPIRGNKRPAKSEKGRSSTKSVHHLLSQFNDKYEDYLAEKSNSEEETE